MRHNANNSPRDSRLPPIAPAEPQRAGLRSLDCGHEISEDGDLVIRRSARDAQRGDAQLSRDVPDDATSVGEKQQAL
jgi:hypothetical protein